MKIKDNLIKEIEEYCKANDLDVDTVINKIVKRGFSIEKFGATPVNSKPEIIEKEVEKIVEVEVEKIVEKIKEVPVEKIVEVIKEVPVEKEVFVTDDTELQKLTDKISKLEEELEKQKSANFHLERFRVEDAADALTRENAIRKELEDYKNEAAETQKRSSQAIMKLNKEKDLLKEEYEEKIKKLETPEPKNDIYNEGGGGSWGSNLMDGIWPKKKR